MKNRLIDLVRLIEDVKNEVSGKLGEIIDNDFFTVQIHSRSILIRYDNTVQHVVYQIELDINENLTYNWID